MVSLRRIETPTGMMAATCVLCNAPVSGGRILCDSCDRPRRRPETANGEIRREPAPAQSVPAYGFDRSRLIEILNAGRVAALLVADGRVAAATEMARQIFSDFDGEVTAERLRTSLSVDVDSLVDGGRSVVIHGHPRRIRIVSVDPSSRVIVFEPEEKVEAATAGLEFLREAVLVPLKSLSESLEAAGRRPGAPQMLRDAASVIEQALSTMALSGDFGESASDEIASLEQLFEKLRERFRSVADRKKASVQINVPDGPAEFDDPGGVGEALAIYLENSLRYIPNGGQIVLGVRTIEHKGEPVLLFFVMDNGPVVPAEYREVIFDAGFVWDPAGTVRTGKDLDQCRRYARKHGGKAWVESRTGKACTFFLSVPNQA